jgi:hypothetical protein
MTSQINPQDINGEYPVAGQPNNTQGFRDNFTNIQTNFGYAASEITELQNKAVLKQALTGGVLDNNMNDALIYAAKIRDFSATLVQVTTTSGPVSIDYTAGHYQAISTTGSIGIGFANWPANNSAGWIRLTINITDVAHTVTLPNSVTNGLVGLQGYSAGVISFGAVGAYSFDFVTYDNGNSITIQDINRPLSYYSAPVTVNSTVASTSTTSGALIVAGGVGVNGDLYVAGNVVGSFVATTQTFAGNLTGGNLLSGGVMSAAGNVSGGNIRTGGQISATGNITGAYIIGDGSQLTNVTVSGGSSIVNGSSNVRVVANSNVTIGVSGTSNVAVWANTGGFVSGILSATGNVFGGNLRTVGEVSATGNVTGQNIIAGSGIGAAGDIGAGGIIFANGNISTSSAMNATGNITGSYFLGNGSFLTGLSSTSRITSGTTEMSVDVPSGNIRATVGGTANIAVFSTSGLNIIGGINATGGLLSSNVNTSGFITATGNITGGNITSNGLISAVGNIAGGNIAVTGNVSLTANVIAGNLTAGAQMIALGNVTGGNIATSGQVRAFSATAVPSGGTAGAGYVFSSAANFGVFFGSGAPTLIAAKGSLYLRSDGTTTNDRMYVNTDGSTAWTAVITAS